MMRSLTINNYRLFENFRINQTARVNLVVGTNNSGKSSLLEAIYLLASEDVTSSLFYILDERGEFVSRSPDVRYDKGLPGGYQVSHIFHGHSLRSGQTATIQSDAGRNALLDISLREFRTAREKDTVQLTLLDDDELEAESRVQALVFEHTRDGLELNREILRTTDDGLLTSRYYSRKIVSPIQSARLITTNYLSYDELAVLWDNITLTPREESVVEALRILEPKVDRISFTSRQTSNSGILLKLKGEIDPIPLGSMGDGMRRVLATIASLVSVEGGTLLVDEIDTGLYYGVLTDMWRLILETSSRINAQVFATTHSWDCVRAFQQALKVSSDRNAGLLIRLERHDERIQAVSYSPSELDIAIKQGIEVR